MLLRSPSTTVSAPGTAADAFRPRSSLRACNTTRCACLTRSWAVSSPRPSDDPVMKTRAMTGFLNAALYLPPEPAPDFSLETAADANTDKLRHVTRGIELRNLLGR